MKFSMNEHMPEPSNDSMKWWITRYLVIGITPTCPSGIVDVEHVGLPWPGVRIHGGCGVARAVIPDDYGTVKLKHAKEGGAAGTALEPDHNGGGGGVHFLCNKGIWSILRGWKYVFWDLGRFTNFDAWLTWASLKREIEKKLTIHQSSNKNFIWHWSRWKMWQSPSPGWTRRTCDCWGSPWRWRSRSRTRRHRWERRRQGDRWPNRNDAVLWSGTIPWNE